MVASHKFPTDLNENSDVDDSTISTDMALAKAIDFMNSKKDIEIKTDMPENAIPFIVALSQEYKFTDSLLMTEFIKDFKILRVSKNRESRKEIIELAKNRQEPFLNNAGFMARAGQFFRGSGNA